MTKLNVTPFCEWAGSNAFHNEVGRLLYGTPLGTTETTPQEALERGVERFQHTFHVLGVCAVAWMDGRDKDCETILALAKTAQTIEELHADVAAAVGEMPALMVAETQLFEKAREAALVCLKGGGDASNP